MSGLAAYGTVIGGAVAGMLVLSAALALTSVAIMNQALRRDDDLPGAIAGSAASIAAGSALGVPASAPPGSPPDSPPSAPQLPAVE
jgi:hypothetical protein